MKVADAIVKHLEGLGVEYIFGVPGDIQTLFLDRICASKIKFITMRNEKCAAFAADQYSRVSKKPGVCYSTVGPGATNLVSGLANATMDKSAVVAISDQVMSDNFGTNTHQYINMEKLFSPETNVAKGSFCLKNPKDVGRCIEDAFVLAMSQPHGAVHISIPADVYSAEADGAAIASFADLQKKVAVTGMSGSVDAVLQTLAAEPKGLILVGENVKKMGAESAFQKMVETLGYPVMTTFRGKGAIRSDHPLAIGVLSRHFKDVLAEIFSSIDVLFLVGYDYSEGVEPKTWEKYNLKVVNMDVVNNEVPGKFTPELSCYGDLSALFSKVGGSVKMRDPQIRVQDLKAAIRKTIYGNFDMENFPIRPHRIIEALDQVFGDEAIYICDVGFNKYYSGLLLQGRNVLCSNGQSAMAFSSGAIGAKLAGGDKPVVVVVGDGGFLMDPQEISTAVRYNVPYTIVIMNNSGLGLTRSAHQKASGNYPAALTFPNPDYELLARSFGAKGHHVRSTGDLIPALQEAKASQKLCIVDVPVEYEGVF